MIRVLALAAFACLSLACAPAGAVGNAMTGETDSPLAPTIQGGATYSRDTRGYLALPPAGGAAKKPGVVMIHEWWGLNDQIKGQADALAKQGYVVLAVDLFKGQVATDAAAARAQTGAIDAAAATANLKDAVAFLRARPDVAKVGSLGWCFGGGWSLKLLQAQPDLAAGVIYYGTLEGDAAKVKGLPPIAGFFGNDDQGPSPAQVDAFDAALTTAGVTHEIHRYDGAGHAFANPTGGASYRAEAAADAWAKTLAFLGKNLQ